ncbi:MAG TPA: hypothetical protein VLX44_06720 [Xanthobacteraceae bacterium]|nr:hypothetical protein [Xanthobacteraceae bacterium]
MVRDSRPPKPRPPQPDPSEPDETVELLRALARRRGAAGPDAPAARRDEAEAFDSLRGLAERLDHQLRAPTGDASDARGRDAQTEPSHEPPARRRVPHQPPLDAPGPWAEFAAALPAARSLVPRLSAGRMVFVLISLMVLVIAAGSRLIGPRIATEAPEAAPGSASAPQTAPLAARPSETVPQLDVPSITKAMAACDEEAARNPASLYFLVLPLIEVAPGKHDWRAVALQSVVNAYFLLSDKEALEGLRDKSLALRPDRYTFAVLDPSTGISYSWTSATGLARLSKPDVSAPKAIKLGFDFSAQQNGPQWSAPFNREPGTCYSVNVLVVR